MHWYGWVVYGVAGFCVLTALVIGLKAYLFYRNVD
jgi:hypothetical protein